MGRLFWKFFIVLWLAQLATGIGIGIAMWLHAPAREQFNTPPPPPFAPMQPGPANFAGTMPPPPLPGHPPPLPLMPLLAGSMVSLIFAALLAWYFSKPIRKLRAAFEAVANGQLDQRLEPVIGQRHDELSDLGRDFDRMTRRLQQLMDGQRRVLHDVSHELRSPLARLQAAIGLARQQPERTEDSLMRIEKEAVRMDALVSELLTLSRLEAGMAGKLGDEIELGELLNNVVDDARFEASTHDCRIEFEPICNNVVRGNAELLHRAIENVLRNAIKHSPPGGAIGIELRASDNAMVCIAITDQGPGVPQADLAAIFEPFFRSDNNQNLGGHGLGLAIAQRVVVAHHGHISASNRPEGGLCITLVLPLQTAA